MDVNIRQVRLEDIEELVELCELHATYERAEYISEGKVEALKQILFSPKPVLFCLVAVQSNHLLGYVTLTKEFSTWDAKYFAHMDCLYVRDSARGQGVGSLLMTKIQAYAVELGCSQMQWQTPKDNLRAIDFYKTRGAQAKHKLRFFLSL